MPLWLRLQSYTPAVENIKRGLLPEPSSDHTPYPHATPLTAPDSPRKCCICVLYFVSQDVLWQEEGKRENGADSNGVSKWAAMLLFLGMLLFYCIVLYCSFAVSVLGYLYILNAFCKPLRNCLKRWVYQDILQITQRLLNSHIQTGCKITATTIKHFSFRGSWRDSCSGPWTSEEELGIQSWRTVKCDGVKHSSGNIPAEPSNPQMNCLRQSQGALYSL